MQEESGKRKMIQIELKLFDKEKLLEGSVKFILEGGTTKEKADMLMNAWNYDNHGKYLYFISKISIVENSTKKQLL
jgi:exopolyphosphatase/pppGpp-phosphohydrolase